MMERWVKGGCARLAGRPLVQDFEIRSEVFAERATEVRRGAEILHVGRPNVPDIDDLMSQMAKVLESGWLTNNGEQVRAFEDEFARLSGARHCISVSNCTLGLQLVFKALDLEGEIIVPALTFVASPHSILLHGCTPVFCDVARDGYTASAETVAPLITERTAAILGVHLWGNACDVECLPELARRHGLPLIYDCAQAVGCGWKSRSIGTFGDASVFSFHATKIVNTFEGGAIVTDDDALAERLRLLRNFGFAGPDRVVALGTNAKLPEISAVMGRASLARLNDYIAVNRRNHNQYADELAMLRGISVKTPAPGSDSNYHYLLLEIDQAEAGISRNALMRALHKEGVLARRYFWPGCHRMEPYRSMPRYAEASLPNTEDLCERTLCLPTGTSISHEDIARVSALIRDTVVSGASKCV